MLVADHLGLDPSPGAPSSERPVELRAGSFPGGATVTVGSAGWVLLGDRAERGLGPALAWARSQELDELNVVLDDAEVAAVVARRAHTFARPARVWWAEGRTLHEAAPAPAPVPIEPPAAAREVLGLLHGSGVEVVVEHGQIRGEIRGLEVARVVVDDSGTARVEVGVGRHDREAFAMVHGDLPTADALALVVDSVDTHRRPGQESQALCRLAPEGWLRWRLVEQPSVLGLVELRAAEPTVPRESVKDIGAAIAVGRDAAGEPVVVACSVGIDLDVVPAAADARAALAPDARLIVVVPERDDHAVTRSLAADLAAPAEVVSLPGDWRRLDREADPS